MMSRFREKPPARRQRGRNGENGRTVRTVVERVELGRDSEHAIKRCRIAFAMGECTFSSRILTYAKIQVFVLDAFR